MSYSLIQNNINYRCWKGRDHSPNPDYLTITGIRRDIGRLGYILARVYIHTYACMYMTLQRRPVTDEGRVIRGE